MQRMGYMKKTRLTERGASAFLETSHYNPRYHSTCTLLCHSSGSIKPYAFTQHTRETPTRSGMEIGNFGASGSEGMGD